MRLLTESMGCEYCNMETAISSRDKKYQIDVWAGNDYKGKKIKNHHISITGTTAPEFTKFDINYCPMCGRKLIQ